MDNSLPNDPPDDGNKQSLPSEELKPPPPFGHNFDPHSNPVDPNNPYQTQPQPPPDTNGHPHHPTHSDVPEEGVEPT